MDASPKSNGDRLMTKRTRTFEDLLPYLKEHKRVGSMQERDFTVAEGYHIEYRGRPVVSTDGRFIHVEDVHGSYDREDTDYIDWSQVQVYKVMKRW
jgi:hypothetical protein